MCGFSREQHMRKALQNPSFIHYSVISTVQLSADALPSAAIVKRQSSHYGQYRYSRHLNINANKVQQASQYSIYTALSCNLLTSSELHNCSGVTRLNTLSSSFVSSALTQTLAPLTSTVKWYWCLTNKCLWC